MREAAYTRLEVLLKAVAEKQRTVAKIFWKRKRALPLLKKNIHDLLDAIKAGTWKAISTVPFKNRKLAKKIAKQPCAWCGWIAGRRHAAHIIDEGPETESNAISLCPNCATVFDEVVRPKFYKALQEYGCEKLPGSWRKDNKISDAIDKLL